MHQTGLCYLGGSMKLVLGEHQGNTNCLKWSSDPRGFEVKGLGVRIVNDMFTPGLLLITFFSRWGWGLLISPLSSLTGLWGVIRKYGIVMNLFSFYKPPRCLLNHLCSARATILSLPQLHLLWSPKLHKVVLIVSRYRPAAPSTADLLTMIFFSLIVSFANLS